MGMSSSGEGSSSSHLTSQFGVSSLILKGVLATVTVAVFFLPLKNLPHHFIEDESKNVYSIKLVDTDVGLIEAPIVRMCVEFELPTSAPTLISA